MRSRSTADSGDLIEQEFSRIEVELIPYYAWANRGLAYMDVWIPRPR